jgi:hypothetical protein
VQSSARGSGAGEYPARPICAYGYHFRSFTVHVSNRTTCGTTPRHIGPRGGKWVGLTPPPRIQVDLLSCVTITNSTHLTFVSAQFKQVCSLTSGRIYYIQYATRPRAGCEAAISGCISDTPHHYRRVDTQLCGRCAMCRTPVYSDSFAMRSSTYDLAGSGLTFKTTRFGSNTGRDF